MRRIVRIVCCLGLVLFVTSGAGCDSETAEKREKNKQKGPAQPSKVIFAFQPQEHPGELETDADEMADYMSEQLGTETDVYIPTSYAGVVEALRGGNAHVAYFSGWPYLAAHQKIGVELLAVEERKGNPYYHSQWYVDADSDIESVADLEGRKVSFTAPTSTSGYLFPLAKVIDESPMESGGDPNDFFSEVIYAGGYQQSLQALLHDRVDAAAASDYAPDTYLDQKERDSIRVLSRQGPVPTHGVAVVPSLPDSLKERVKEAFLDLNDGEHAELLQGLYGAEKLVERSHDEHVGALADALRTVGADRNLEGFGAGSGRGSGAGSGEGSGSGSGVDHEAGESAGSGSGSGVDHEAGESAGSGEGSGAGSGQGD